MSVSSAMSVSSVSGRICSLAPLRWLLAVLCCGGLAFGACAAEPVLIVFDADNPPLMYRHDRQAAGIYPAIVSAVMARAGIPVRFGIMPWKRALIESGAGNGGIGGIYQTEERLQRYDFSDLIMTENIVVYFNTAKPINFRSVSDFHGKTIGVIRGWSYGEAFDAARNSGLFKAEEVSGDRSNFIKLADGQVDAILSIEESGRAIMAAGGFGNIGQSRSYLASNKAYLAFAKSAQRKDVLAGFNKALAAMRQDGSLDRIVARELAR